MPPKVTENNNVSVDSFHSLEFETREAAQRVVASYAREDDLLDAAMLMSMLGVEPEGLDYAALERDIQKAAEVKTVAKKASKKTAKKAAKKAPAKKAAAKKIAKKAPAKKAAAKKKA